MPYDSPSRPNRRRYYRVKYPEEARPVFRLGSLLTTVIDTSEEGLRVLMPSGGHVLDLEVGAPVRGVLILHSRDVHVVSGHVVRMDGRVVAIALNHAGINFPTIVAEQRWLRKLSRGDE